MLTWLASNQKASPVAGWQYKMSMSHVQKEGRVISEELEILKAKAILPFPTHYSDYTNGLFRSRDSGLLCLKVLSTQ